MRWHPKRKLPLQTTGERAWSGKWVLRESLLRRDRTREIPLPSSQVEVMLKVNAHLTATILRRDRDQGLNKIFSMFLLLAPPPGRNITSQWLAPRFGMASL